MMVIILLVYAVIVWLIFFKFKWIPWNTLSKSLTATIGLLVVLWVLALLNTGNPSGQVSLVGRVVEVSPTVEGRIVDIAAERYNAFMFESDLRLQIALVQGQHEIIGLRERVNVMSDDIAVRKIDAGSGLHHEQVWHETCVNLVHYCVVCRCR